MSKASEWAKKRPPSLSGVTNMLFAYLHTSGDVILGYGDVTVTIPGDDALKLGQWLVATFGEETP